MDSTYACELWESLHAGSTTSHPKHSHISECAEFFLRLPLKLHPPQQLTQSLFHGTRLDCTGSQALLNC